MSFKPPSPFRSLRVDAATSAAILAHEAAFQAEQEWLSRPGTLLPFGKAPVKTQEPPVWLRFAPRFVQDMHATTGARGRDAYGNLHEAWAGVLGWAVGTVGRTKRAVARSVKQYDALPLFACAL